MTVWSVCQPQTILQLCFAFHDSCSLFPTHRRFLLVEQLLLYLDMSLSATHCRQFLSVPYVSLLNKTHVVLLIETLQSSKPCFVWKNNYSTRKFSKLDKAWMFDVLFQNAAFETRCRSVFVCYCIVFHLSCICLCHCIFSASFVHVTNGAFHSALFWKVIVVGPFLQQPDLFDSRPCVWERDIGRSTSAVH